MQDSSRQADALGLGKLMPWELIPGFLAMNSEIFSTKKIRNRRIPVRVNLDVLSAALKNWRLPVEGYVGYERAVVTAGGVSADGIVPKSLESRLVEPGVQTGARASHLRRTA